MNRHRTVIAAAIWLFIAGVARGETVKLAT